MATRPVEHEVAADLPNLIRVIDELGAQLAEAQEIVVAHFVYQVAAHRINVGDRRGLHKSVALGRELAVHSAPIIGIYAAAHQAFFF